MLHSITPLGERSRDRNWRVTATAYTLGLVVGGAAFGATLGGVGEFVIGRQETTASRVVIAVLLIVLVAAGAAADAGWKGVRLPTSRRQVDQSWLREYRGGVCGLGYGLQLGVGVITVVVASSIYLAVLVAFLSASPFLGGAILGTFGLVKAIPIMFVRRVTEPGAFLRLEKRFASTEAPVARAARWLQGATMVWLVLVLAFVVI